MAAGLDTDIRGWKFDGGLLQFLDTQDRTDPSDGLIHVAMRRGSLERDT